MSYKFNYENLSKSIDENRIPTTCPNCNEQSTSICTILNIPHFRELLMILFNCDNCGFRDNDIQGNGILQPKGVKFTLKIENSDDLNRQIVLSTFSSVSIIDIDFEFPKSSNRSLVTTIEGLISSAIDDLSQYYEQLESDETSTKLFEVINTLKEYVIPTRKFTIILDDPSGNSYIEHLSNATNLNKIEYQRTDDQTRAMGYSTLDDVEKSNTLDLNIPLEDDYEAPLYELQTNCPDCGNSGNNKICQVNVPGFRECIIFSFLCNNCGSKSTEVKPGGPIGEYGQKWQLEISHPDDLNRDVILSDMASIKIPKIDFTMMAGSIGSVFTTVEGVLEKIADNLESSNPFITGDSVRDISSGLKNCCKMLRDIASFEDDNTIFILDDPTARSFIASIENDNRLKIENYKRSIEQDDELGILDMKV